MSNCIEFVSGSSVSFSPDEIDCEELEKFLQPLVSFSEADFQKIRERRALTTELVCGWWFLALNTDLWHDHEGLFTEVIIKFGEGRSSHCWRDFQGTLEVLSQFMLREKHRTLVVSDEGDGYKTRHAVDVEFLSGKFSVENREWYNY
jgi:hypothetical protein